MPWLKLRLEVLFVGYLVVDATDEEDDGTEINVAAFGKGDLDKAMQFIRDEIDRDEAERVRIAQDIANRGGAVISAVDRFSRPQTASTPEPDGAA